MSDIWLPIASMIEFGGAVIIAFSVLHAGIRLLFFSLDVKESRLIISAGAIMGLDFKMAATLLKALHLNDWEQIWKFAVILLLRSLLKFTLNSHTSTLSVRPAKKDYQK